MGGNACLVRLRMNSQLVLRRAILTPQVLPGMDLVAPFSFVAALRPQTSLSLLVRVDSYLRLVRLVAAAVTVQRLVPGPRADGEADRVVELRVGCRGYFLGAGPVPVAGREELGADGLVEGVVYYGGGADGDLPIMPSTRRVWARMSLVTSFLILQPPASLRASMMSRGSALASKVWTVGRASTLMGMKPDCFIVPWQSA
jgi:hypothetical protein